MSRCAYPKCALTFGHEGRHRAYESGEPLPPEGPPAIHCDDCGIEVSRVCWPCFLVRCGVEREAASPALDVGRLRRIFEEHDLWTLIADEYQRLDPTYQATLPTIDDVRGIFSPDRLAAAVPEEPSE